MSNHDISMTIPKEGLPSESAEKIFNPWLGFRDQSKLFENDEIGALIQRGLFYARAGVPIHFQGTAGRGKTAVAMAIADRLGKPVRVMTGNDWVDVENMVGKKVGQSTTALVDKYIPRVRRSEVTVKDDWENAPLAEAMISGQTLVYDEFTRSNARANGVLLSVLEEGILTSSDPLATDGHIHAHPDFRIILTSNPHDYAGVNRSPDALLDRMVTFHMPRFSLETESGIVAARTGISSQLSKRIVHLVNDLIPQDGACSMRAAILIGQIAAMRLRSSQLSEALLAQITSDVLGGRGTQVSTCQVAKHLALSASSEALQ